MTLIFLLFFFFHGVFHAEKQDSLENEWLASKPMFLGAEEGKEQTAPLRFLWQARSSPNKC